MNLANKGVYCLIIRLFQECNITIGCLGTFNFPMGFYIYTGSAQNNLKSRIERHLQREKKVHWHIDYLLNYGHVIGIYTYPGEKNMECVLNDKIGSIKNATIPVKGFGSSDCSCIAHLHFFQNNPGYMISGFNGKLASQSRKFSRAKSGSLY